MEHSESQAHLKPGASMDRVTEVVDVDEPHHYADD